MKNRSFVLVGMIVTLLAGVLNSQSGVEVHAASATAVAGWQEMASPAGKTIWVAPAVRLTSSDIERAEARSTNGGEPGVAIVLTEDGARKMAELSSQQANQLIALLLDGKVIWAPLVRGTIGKEGFLSGGPGGLTQAQIDRLLASFKP
jgi:preprotein translocase subunit SecD